jgi:hypothetical protein
MGREYGMCECPLQTAAEYHVLLIRVFSVFGMLNNVGDNQHYMWLILRQTQH